jgi:hypothetical protein
MSGDDRLVRTLSPMLRLKMPEQRVNVDESRSKLRPKIVFSRSRRFCAVCNIRKTQWLVEYGDRSFFPKLFSTHAKVKDHGWRHRRCFKCMTDLERAALRSGF